MPRIAGLALASVLHFAPILARTVQTVPALAVSPMAIVFNWAVGALAITGAYHTVSAATAVLASSATIQGTAGVRLSYQIKINDGQNRTPESWVIGGLVFGRTGATTTGLPAGLSLALNTGIISGIPTQPGNFTVMINAYEKPNLRGGRLVFTLTFSVAPGVAIPVIAAQPASKAANEGGSATFEVAAAGSTPLTFQWRFGGQTIPNATAPTLTLSSLKLTDTGDYSVVISNSAGAVTSAVARLVVLPVLTPPAIVTSPASVAVHPGEPWTLAVDATGNGPLSFQWQRNGVDVTGGTTSRLTAAVSVPDDAGDYAVVISNSSGAVMSSSVKVVVVPLALELRSLGSNTASLALHTIPGRRYLIEATDDLGATAWEILSDQVSNGDTLVFIDAGANKPQRFWRYRPVPQATGG